MFLKTQEQIMQNWKAMEVPLVSIRCITYNQERYIAQALDGFLMQETNFPFEIIVHDDASSDRTSQIIKEYEKNYPKIIKPIYETENQYSKKDNTLDRIILPFLKGKYTAYCEGDDYWTNKEKLQKQIDFLENNPEYGFCCTDVDIYYEDIDKYDYAVLKNKKTIINLDNAIESRGYMLNLTWVMKTDLYNKLVISSGTKFYIDTALKLFYDLNLNAKGKVFDIVTGVYRRNSGGLSAFSKEDEIKQYTFYKSFFSLIKEYIPKFKNVEETEKYFYFSLLPYVLSPAIKNNDLEIINDYVNYVSKTKGLFLCQLYNNIFEKENEIKTSISYRLGDKLLRPIKKIKTIIKK